MSVSLNICTDIKLIILISSLRNARYFYLLPVILILIDMIHYERCYFIFSFSNAPNEIIIIIIVIPSDGQISPSFYYYYDVIVFLPMFRAAEKRIYMIFQRSVVLFSA